MKCPKCGEECKDTAKFCYRCGTDLSSYSMNMQDPGSTQEPASTNDPVSMENPEIAPDQTTEKHGLLSWFKSGTKGMTALKCAATACVCAAVVAVVLFSRQTVQATQLQDYMEAGYTYMEDGDYSEAVAAFTSATEVDPRSSATPYNMLARAYKRMGKPGQAERIHRLALTRVRGRVARAQIVNVSHYSNNLTLKEFSYPATTFPSYDDSDSNNTIIINDGPTGSTTDDSTTDTAIQVASVNESAVTGLLQTFSTPALNEVEDYYSGGSNEYSSFEPAQVYTLSALALIEDDSGIYSGEPVYCCIDNRMYEYDEATGTVTGYMTGEDEDEAGSPDSDVQEYAEPETTDDVETEFFGDFDSKGTDDIDLLMPEGEESEISENVDSETPESEEPEIQESFEPEEVNTEVAAEEEASATAGYQIDKPDELYIAMSDSLCSKYEKYMSDIFGRDYSISGIEQYAGSLKTDWGTVIRKDAETGKYYLLVTDLGTEANVTVGAAFAPDNSKNLQVLAKYSQSKGLGKSGSYYALCEIASDSSSGYGYTVSGITPVGETEPDWSAISKKLGTDEKSLDSYKQEINNKFGI